MDSLMIGFRQKLINAWLDTGSQLMVGLDPEPSRFPVDMKDDTSKIYDFCRGIVDATAEHVCGFKLQIAYFAANKAENQLEQISEYIRTKYPNLVLILDAKRGDIGATAKQYASEAFDRYQADAVTVNPYMGFDSIQPYLDYKNKGVIILCRTSNPGGSDLQFQVTENQQPLYLRVADMVANKWDTDKQCALVVGATYPQEIAQVRQIIGDMPLLIPGIGAQGGDVNATVTAGRTTTGQGMMINSSRAIIYASNKSDWQDAAAISAKQTKKSIIKADN